MLLRPFLPLLCAAGLLLGTPAHAQSSPANDAGGQVVDINHDAVQDFIETMVKRHQLDRAYVSYALSRARYSEQIAKLILPPPSPAAKNWQAYRNRFVEPTRIQAGLRFWKQHEATLQRAESQFGVPAEIIVGIIGVETLYGRHMGGFRVLDAMYTLTFGYPQTPNRASRNAMFREQFEDFLVWCQETNQDPAQVLGSYAGAIGLPQFMPTSLRNFVVDFDGDGKVSLRNSPADAIGSVANFLRRHGWESGRPVVWSIGQDTGSRGVAEAAATGLPEPSRKLKELLQAGMELGEPVDRKREAETEVLIVDLPTPDQPTEYRVGLRNFYALTRYNRSFFYAQAVYELGQALKAQRR